MYLNKYGIIIKKKLKEKYNKKYLELQDNGILDDLLQQKQNEVASFKRAMVNGAKKSSLLFKQQFVAIQDRVTNEINNIVDELGGTNTDGK